MKTYKLYKIRYENQQGEKFYMAGPIKSKNLFVSYYEDCAFIWTTKKAVDSTVKKLFEVHNMKAVDVIYTIKQKRGV